MAERRTWRYAPVRFAGPNKRCVVRSRSSAVLLALAVVALAPALGVAQYAPQWRVGDWWVVKTSEPSNSGFGGGWEWNYTRYDVVGIEKVGKRDCYVLETRDQGPRGTLSKTKNVLYVRTDNWLVVRQVVTTTFHDTLLPPVITDYPLGLFGPFRAGEPRLPRFPLQPGNNTDTVFRFQRRDDFSAWLREISEVADSALVKRLLDEGDTTGGRVVHPTGAVYEVRSELGGNLGPGPLPGEREILQSIQLWSDDLPWRLYEAVVDYRGPKHVGRVQERSWLVAVGKRGR
jgi:hypothetical protein